MLANNGSQFLPFVPGKCILKFDCIDYDCFFDIPQSLMERLSARDRHLHLVFQLHL
jgi:hypothetical protein